MITRFADWLARRLLEQRGGRDLAPGSLQVYRETGSFEREFTVIARGDSFDIYYGQRTIYNHAISAKTALRLAWFIIWVWWICGTWCGLKLRLWQWALKNRG